MQYYYLSNKEIDLSNSDIIVNPYDCLDQHMNKGIVLYSYSGVFNSKFLENNEYSKQHVVIHYQTMFFCQIQFKYMNQLNLQKITHYVN